MRERRDLLYTSKVLAATGKRLGLSDNGADEKRVFRYVGKEKEEEGEDWEVEEEEAAALLDEDILIGDWRCRRDWIGEVVLVMERSKEAEYKRVRGQRGFESLLRRSRSAKGTWELQRPNRVSLYMLLAWFRNPT